MSSGRRDAPSGPWRCDSSSRGALTSSAGDGEHDEVGLRPRGEQVPRHDEAPERVRVEHDRPPGRHRANGGESLGQVIVELAPAFDVTAPAARSRPCPGGRTPKTSMPGGGQLVADMLVAAGVFAETVDEQHRRPWCRPAHAPPASAWSRRPVAGPARSSRRPSWRGRRSMASLSLSGRGAPRTSYPAGMGVATVGRGRRPDLRRGGTRSTTRTSGWCWVGDEALVIDTRSTHVQAREIQDRPPRIDGDAGDGRRGHPRPFRSRLRQSRVPTGDDLGSGAMRYVHGQDRGGSDGPRSRPGSRRSPPTCRGRHRSARSHFDDAATIEVGGAPGRAAVPRPRPHGPRRGHHGPGHGVVLGGRPDRGRRGPRLQRRLSRSTGRPRPRHWPALVDGVVVPGHGDHAGEHSPRTRHESFHGLASWRGASEQARWTSRTPLQPTPFETLPAEDIRRPLKRALEQLRGELEHP